MLMDGNQTRFTQDLINFKNRYYNLKFKFNRFKLSFLMNGFIKLLDRNA